MSLYYIKQELTLEKKGENLKVICKIKDMFDCKF